MAEPSLSRKTAPDRKLEKIVRGFSSARRIAMLRLLKARPGLSLAQITQRLKINVKSTHQHLTRAVGAGLVRKRRRGMFVHHTLTRRGEAVLEFLKGIV